MTACPACGRPVAVARPGCLYCGAALGAREASAAADAAGSTPAPQQDRVLLVLDLERAPVELLERAAGLTAYEAGLFARRGGYHLFRVLPAPAAEAAAAVLAAQGLAVVPVPEAEARARPLCALGGELLSSELALRTAEGPVQLRREHLLLVVSGPIVREYRPPLARRRVDTARLEQGFRVHLHRHAERRAVEIDPANLELGFAPSGSARLEVEAWLAEVAAGVPRDDGFRRLPAALAPEQPERQGPLAAAGALRRRSPGGEDTTRDVARTDEPLLLDNLEQFRFYSGWRAAAQRRRSG
jgi:hypothetical protein